MNEAAASSDATTHGATGKKRFVTLDLMRVLGSFTILVTHGAWSLGSTVLGGGAVAVSMLFMLSGFVLAYRYEQGLRSRGTAWAFLGKRLVRLYPLYLLGTLLGALATLGSPEWAGRDGVLLLTLIAGLLFIPTLAGRTTANDVLFPLNYPAWALLAEILANALYAVVARWLRTGLLLALILATGLAVVSIAVGDEDIPQGVSSLSSAFARGTWCFFTGVALYRLHLRWPAPVLHGLIPAAILAAAISSMPFLSWPIALSFMFLVAPLTIWLGASARLPVRWARPLTGAGLLTYAVYVLHAPIMSLVDPWLLDTAPTIGVPTQLFYGLFIPIVIVASWLAWRFYDLPVRSRLSARLSAEGRRGS